MAKIRAFPAPNDSVSTEKYEPQRIKKRVSKTVSEFFPSWVLTVVLGLLWLAVLPGVMVVIAENFASGLIAGIGLVLSSTLALLLYPTYSPAWRTLGWAVPLSLALCYLVMKMGDVPGKLLLIIIPVGLFVAARVNMNGRKLISHRR